MRVQMGRFLRGECVDRLDEGPRLLDQRQLGLLLHLFVDIIPEMFQLSEAMLAGLQPRGDYFLLYLGRSLHAFSIGDIRLLENLLVASVLLVQPIALAD